MEQYLREEYSLLQKVNPIFTCKFDQFLRALFDHK